MDNQTLWKWIHRWILLSWPLYWCTMPLLLPIWWHSQFLLNCIYLWYTCLWVWLGQNNPIPTSWKVLLVMKLPVLLCYFISDFSFIDNCHKFGNIGKHPCASWATNILHLRSCELWFLNEKCPPLTLSCISYNIVGIFKSWRQCFKTSSWPWWYNLPYTKGKHKSLKARFFFCSWV